MPALGHKWTSESSAAPLNVGFDKRLNVNRGKDGITISAGCIGAGLVGGERSRFDALRLDQRPLSFFTGRARRTCRPAETSSSLSARLPESCIFRPSSRI